MKCTNCGCKKLQEISILESDVIRIYGSVWQTVSSYACEKCGHVELYVCVDEEDGDEKEYYGTPRR